MKLGKAFRNIAVLGALAALLVGFPAQAAEYPTKEIRIIQPYPSGGFNDVVTRKMAEVIAQDQLLSKDILAVAITGANTRNALQTVLDAAPDGYTLLMHHTALVATKVSGQLPIGYTDFEMLGGLCAGPIAIDVMKDSPWKNVQEMIADVKGASRASIRLPCRARGGTAHIATLHFLKLAGIPVNAFRYLPLSGGAETMKALLGKKGRHPLRNGRRLHAGLSRRRRTRAGRFDPLEPARLQGRPHAQGHGPSRFPPYPYGPVRPQGNPAGREGQVDGHPQDRDRG